MKEADQRIDHRQSTQKQFYAEKHQPDAVVAQEDGQAHTDENRLEASMKDDEQCQPEERTLRGRVPEEDFAEEVLHCIQINRFLPLNIWNQYKNPNIQRGML